MVKLNREPLSKNIEMAPSLSARTERIRVPIQPGSGMRVEHVTRYYDKTNKRVIDNPPPLIKKPTSSKKNRTAQ